MYPNFWFEFSILLVAAMVGSIAILPYSLRLLKESKRKKPITMPYPMLFLLSVLQNAVLFAVFTSIGLFAAHQIGHVAVVSTTLVMVAISVLSGALSGFFLLLADLLFLPHLPEALIATARKTSLWENFTASFYGGINEELFMRLFGVSVLMWLVFVVWHTQTYNIFWIINILIAILFGLGHFPATKQLVGKLTPLIVIRALLLNGPLGLLCGWLFWEYGIVAAMLAHFSADIVYHVLGTVVLRKIKPA